MKFRIVNFQIPFFLKVSEYIPESLILRIPEKIRLNPFRAISQLFNNSN